MALVKAVDRQKQKEMEKMCLYMCINIKNQVSITQINLGAYFLFSFVGQIDSFNESKVEEDESVVRTSVSGLRF